MVPRQQVIDYISSNLRSGYDLPSIRSRLIASGYEPGEVNAAIDVVKSGKTVGGAKSNSHMFVMLGISMIGFLLIAATALVFLQQGADSPISSVTNGVSLDKPTTPAKTTPTPTTQNPSTTNKPSTTSTTPKTPSTTTTTSSNFQGTTTVRDTIPSVDYGTGNSQTTLTTRLAIENRVNQLAASKPDEAATLCMQINTLAGQQSCLNTVAQASEESRFCTMIADVDSADTCLTSLALKQAEDVNMCKQMKSEIRFRQCVVLYDSQSQLDIVQKAAAQVATQPLAEAPVLTEQQQVDAYSVDFDSAITQTPVDDSQTVVEQTEVVVVEETQETTTQETTTQDEVFVEEPVVE